MPATPAAPLDKSQGSTCSAQTATPAPDQARGVSTTESGNAIRDKRPGSRGRHNQITRGQEGLLKEIQALEDEIAATKKIKEGKGIEIEDLDKEIARLEGEVQGLLQMLMARTEAAAARRAD